MAKRISSCLIYRREPLLVTVRPGNTGRSATVVGRTGQGDCILQANCQGQPLEWAPGAKD